MSLLPDLQDRERMAASERLDSQTRGQDDSSYVVQPIVRTACE